MNLLLALAVKAAKEPKDNDYIIVTFLISVAIAFFGYRQIRAMREEKAQNPGMGGFFYTLAIIFGVGVILFGAICAILIFNG